MLTCKEMTELVTDYLERRMSRRRRMSFWMHVSMCGGCRAYLSQMKQTIRVVGQLPDEPMPPEVGAELRRRLASFKLREPT